MLIFFLYAGVYTKSVIQKPLALHLDAYDLIRLKKAYLK